MDFYELKAFVVLSQTLHFARTSSKINLSPSALSRLIARLESETGVQLLERDCKGVVLTKYGRDFAVFAKKCLEERETLTNTLAHKTNTITGTLHVYASVTACYSVMPPFLKELSEKYPDIHLSIETGDPAGAIGAIREGRAELAVAAIPEGGITDLIAVPVLKTPLIFAAATGGAYENVSGSPQDIVSSVPLILPKSGLARDRFDLWVSSRNVQPLIAAETEGNEAIMALVKLGLGIGLVPEIVLTTGPYVNGFTSHAAGNALGSYEVGFVEKLAFKGSDTALQIRGAVDSILGIK